MPICANASIARTTASAVSCCRSEFGCDKKLADARISCEPPQHALEKEKKRERERNASLSPPFLLVYPTLEQRETHRQRPSLSSVPYVDYRFHFFLWRPPSSRIGYGKRPPSSIGVGAPHSTEEEGKDKKGSGSTCEGQGKETAKKTDQGRQRQESHHRLWHSLHHTSREKRCPPRRW